MLFYMNLMQHNGINMYHIKKHNMKVKSLYILCGLSVLALFGCSTKTDYDALATWKFKNASSYVLEINGSIEEKLNFSLAKGEDHSFEITIGTGKDVSENDFISPYTPESTTIKLDGERVITTSKITERKNYTAEKISDRHYQFTYTFTDADFPVE